MRHLCGKGLTEYVTAKKSGKRKKRLYEQLQSMV